LDEALIRPGRFDMHVEIKLPEDIDRALIWKSFEKRFLLLLNRVEMDELVKRTKGFTGADMEMVVREGALDAIREAEDNGEVQGVFYRNLERAFQGIGKWWNPGLGK
jgi:transitional endoplasmic reticulum ATPase